MLRRPIACSAWRDVMVVQSQTVLADSRFIMQAMKHT